MLPDGRVLVTGGDHDYSSPIPHQNTNAEIYSPAYLFAGDGSPAVRPTVTAAPDVAELGDTIFVETPDAADITKALWIVPGAVTHAQNWTQRANILDFTAVDGGLNIELPANFNEAPIGYYMLFLVNEEGVPSMAEWIRATPNIKLPGDFNGDDVVDEDDYTVWRDNLGAANESAINDNGNHLSGVDAADYDVWKAGFGQSAGAGAGSSAVPEPATFVILLSAMLAALMQRCSVSRTERQR